MTQAGANYRTARLVALVAGLLGAALAILTPFLPVKQTTAQLSWPQNGTLSSVTAPLIGYVATDLSISVPCQAAAGLTADTTGPNTGKTVLLSTVPKQAPKAVDRGLLIQRANNDLVVVVRNTPVVVAPMSQVLSPACRKLTFSAHADKVTGEFVGLTKGSQQGADAGDANSPLRGERSGYDFRPQIVGIFTDLSGPAPPGLSFSATVDTRYGLAPTPLKMAAMVLGVLCTLASLIALHILDTSDGAPHRRLLPARWWSLSALDGLVVAVLVWWHFVGANTSDDGYILTMARVSENAGYMANYYRWFGTPESPFGWYYDLLAMWAHVTTASIWMRLPTLLMACACWWLISREVIPRLGVAVKHSRAAAWTAAGMFLAFWLPLNNGLRPEPIIALGILATWCSVERGVATSRLLPVAIACIIGALTLFSGPTGIASIGALLVAIGPLRTILHRRSRRFGLLPLLAPIMAATTVTIILMFRDQTFASVAQANALKRAVGPSLSWFDEHTRYERLYDGHAGRLDRAALRGAGSDCRACCFGGDHAAPRSHPGHRGRTEPSHHRHHRHLVRGDHVHAHQMDPPLRGVRRTGRIAGRAGRRGGGAGGDALQAQPLGIRRCGAVHHRVRVRQRQRLVVRLQFRCAVVQSDARVQAGFRDDPARDVGCRAADRGLDPFLRPRRDAPPGRHWWSRLPASPLAVVAWLLVVFEVASLTLGMINQYPAWSVGRSNLQALTGKTCGLADDVLVESDPNAGMLQPVDVQVADALGSASSQGFSPNGIPDRYLDPDRTPRQRQLHRRGRGRSGNSGAAPEAGTEGGAAVAPGVNGSRAPLPYGLDPATHPDTGQLAGRRPATGPAALGLVPAACARRPRRRLRATGGDIGGRALRSGRGHRAVGHRRAGRGR